MKIYLETSHMILREFVETDWHHIKDLDSDPEVMKFLTNGIPSPDSEVDRVMGIFLSMNKKWNGRFGFWAALEKETQEFMGWFHLRPPKTDPENAALMEIGYRLKKKFWGKGIGTEGSLALINKARKEFGIREFCAQTMHNNLASQNIMKKCGMTFWKDDVFPDFPGEDKRVVWYKVGF